jgi:hypothetical protein
MDATNLKEELEQRVRAKLGNRLRNLEIRLSEDAIILNGQAPTYHVKQLAQHSICEYLPKLRLYNAIHVV